MVFVRGRSPLHHLEERRRRQVSASPTTVLASSLQYASASTQIKDLASREDINELYSLYQYSGPDGII